MKKDIFGDEVKEVLVDNMNFADLFEGATAQVKRSVGDRFQGQILSIGKNEVFIATGTPVDGTLPLREILDKENKPKFKIGDQIPVQIIRLREGEVFLKFAEGVGSSADVESLEDAYDMELPVDGKVIEVVKGGFRVLIMGKTCFCPLSQMDNRRIEDQQKYVNTRFDFMITQFDERGRNIVVSRRRLLDLQNAEKEGTFLLAAKVGEIYQGEVTRLENFGAFVRLENGPEGLIPISELAWGRIRHPSDIVRSEQLVSVKLLNINEDKESGKLRISLSLKQAGGESDPWLTAMTKYSVGSQHKGTVEKKENFGMFVSIIPGVSGLLPKSKWRDHVDHQQFELKKNGDEIYIRIDEIDFETRRITFSLPNDGQDDSWKEHAQAGSFGSGTFNVLSSLIQKTKK